MQTLTIYLDATFLSGSANGGGDRKNGRRWWYREQGISGIMVPLASLTLHVFQVQREVEKVRHT